MAITLTKSTLADRHIEVAEPIKQAFKKYHDYSKQFEFNEQLLRGKQAHKTKLYHKFYQLCISAKVDVNLTAMILVDYYCNLEFLDRIIKK